MTPKTDREGTVDEQPEMGSRERLREYGREHVSLFLSPTPEHKDLVNWFTTVKNSQGPLIRPNFDKEEEIYELDRGGDVPRREEIAFRRVRQHQCTLSWNSGGQDLATGEVLGAVIESIIDIDEPFQVQMFDFGTTWVSEYEGNHFEVIADVYYDGKVRAVSRRLSEYLDMNVGTMDNDVRAYWTIGEEHQLGFRAVGTTDRNEALSEDWDESKTLSAWIGVLKQNASEIPLDELTERIRGHREWVRGFLWDGLVGLLVEPLDERVLE